MADPLSITAAVLAVVTAAIKSTKSLCETVQRFKDRNKTLRRLQHELEDLANILDSLTQVINTETSMLELLQGPIDRCSQVCREFEQSMMVFGGKSKTGFLDWTKMEFMRGDINEFIDTIAGYKSTITVGLGTINLHTSKVSQKVLQEYNEIVRDTVYDLKIHLQRIDEKMARYTPENTNASDISVDLKDESAVTKQCLLICEEAKSYIESLINREPTILQEAPQSVSEDYIQNRFEAQLLARQALDENRDRLAEAIGRLRERLESLILNEGPKNESERLKLEEDIKSSKQCLEICKVASEISHQKIYRIGEVIADGDSDQVVVTTLADLFDVKKALSTGRSAQLIGSMTDETLRNMTDKRYSSRFGAFAGDSVRAPATITTSPSVVETQKSKHNFPSQMGNGEQSSGPEARRHRPSSNEVRKRQVDGENGLRTTSTKE